MNDEIEGRIDMVNRVNCIKETLKFDEGKPCISDLPQLSLISLAKVFNYGSKKYSKFNYSHGTEWLRYYDAAQRHMNSWMTNDDIDLFIPHQANYRIIKAVGDALDFKDEQKVLTVDKYGNTSSASIPMAINDCYESGRLKSGDTILLDAFGGGLTWGSALVKFASK